MLEIDLSKMQLRIDAAVAAVHLRMEEVAISEGDSRAEVQEMSDALQNLRSLRKMNTEFRALQSRRRATHRRKVVMRRMCRRRLGSSWRRRQRASEELLRRVRIVTDPAKLAYLYASQEATRQC